MTPRSDDGPGGPSQQRPTPSAPPHAPQGWSGGMRREGHDPPDADGEAVLAPREARLIEESVTRRRAARPRSGRRRRAHRGRVPARAAAAVGPRRGTRRLDRRVPGAPGPAGLALTGVDRRRRRRRPSPPTRPDRPAPSRRSGARRRSRTGPGRTPGCGRRWTSSRPTWARRPGDPFEPVVAASVTAIGWCAPVDGHDRPPVAVDRDACTGSRTAWRAPSRTTAWSPPSPMPSASCGCRRPRGVGNRPTWPMGRYVIELRSASGAYRRFLGLELRTG